MATTVVKEKVNIIEVKDGRLIVDVALSGGRKSASGKSTVLFTTGGNVPVGDSDMKIGITLFRKV